MHGCKNDYLIVDALVEGVPPGIAQVTKQLADRFSGLGSDGAIVLCRAGQGVEAHCAMRIFNADGSEAEMCGNGIRCVARYMYDRGLAPQEMRVDTLAGELSAPAPAPLRRCRQH
jgi:diaminopimelate epimerase